MATGTTPGASRPWSFTLPLLVLVAGAFLTAGLFLETRTTERRLAEDDFRRQAEALANALQGGIDRDGEVLEAVVALYVHNHAVSRGEFRRFAGRLLPRHRDIQALEWIPRVADGQRAAYEGQARRDGLPDFRIQESPVVGQLVQAARRPEYFPVYFVEPRTGNERALGFDLASSPVRRAALESARDSGNPVATAPITLIQESGSQRGFLVFAPVYGIDAEPGPKEERRLNLRGFVLGVFRIGDMVDHALEEIRTETVALSLRDGKAPPGEDLLYRRLPADAAASGQYRLDLPLGVPGRDWSLRVESTAAFEADHDLRRAWWVLGGGLFLTALLAAFLHALAGRAREQQDHALALADTASRLEREVAERRQAQAEERTLSEALRQSQGAIIIADRDLRVVYVNPAFTRLFGYRLEEVAGQSISLLAPDAGVSSLAPLAAAQVARERGAYSGEALRRTKDGRAIPVLLNVAPVLDEGAHIVGFVGAMTDLTELKRAEAEARSRLAEVTRINGELGQAQNQLLQSEKMASIGLLAAGVAHEINNPIGYVQSNLATLAGYIGDFLALLDAYGRLEAQWPQDEAKLAELRALKERADLAYLRDDVEALLRESREGIDRVKKIVADLKDFSRIDSAEQWRAEDLHHGIESTLNVVWNELKYKCEVRKEYGELPPVECLLPQLNQVFMNLLVNAAQAIEDKGVVTIRTGVAGEEVWIEIADTGKGIAPEHLKRVFDPFFTTKPVGKGTGLGLSVSYSIVQKHHGTIEVDSKPGEGTTFRIRLPVRQPPAMS